MIALVLWAAAPASVCVAVSRRVAARPSAALDAFFERTWLRGGGGGLPAVWLGEYGDGQTRVGSTRTLWPIAMGERVECVEVGPSEANVRYAVVDSGALFGGADIAHSGDVRFSSPQQPPAEGAGAADEAAGPCCELVWTVAFSPPPGHSAAFWQRVTELAIGAAADDLAAHVGRREHEATMVVRAPLYLGAAEAWREWPRFVWVGGGALRFGPLPLPPPIALPDDTRLVLPPGLVERILRRDETELSYSYAVLNPGFLVLYPCSEHAGTVRFEEARGGAEGGCVMEWVVRLRPRPFGSALVRRVTEAVVCALAANFAREVKRLDGAAAGRGSGPPGPEAAWRSKPATAGPATAATAHTVSCVWSARPAADG